MGDDTNSFGQETRTGPWRGIDFSGVTLLIGVSTGQLLQVLSEQVALADGLLVALSYHPDELTTIASGPDLVHVAPVRARPRQIPLLDQMVDLLVINGVLRETPTERLRAMATELWRVLVPGGKLRISDIIEPTEAETDRTWAVRNEIIRRLAQTLGRPTALAVDLRAAAVALAAVGFEDLNVSILPGYPLTEAWLQETANAVRNMASRLPDASLRHQINERDLPRLAKAFAQGDQRAAQRFVLSGTRIGSMALDMAASFTEEDLRPPD